jgi:hypothetical protein
MGVSYKNEECMKTGTKSLLFGVHQFAYHPVTVYLAWLRLYRRLPNAGETLCILIHDWGYWGKQYMDDEAGERHPELAAKIARRLLGPEYERLCLFHSRHYARNAGAEPSKLCWADKLSILFYPRWFYLALARASGELIEYRLAASRAGLLPTGFSDREWFNWIEDRFIKLAYRKKGDAVSYVNPPRWF